MGENTDFTLPHQDDKGVLWVGEEHTHASSPFHPYTCATCAYYMQDNHDECHHIYWHLHLKCPMCEQIARTNLHG